MFAPDRVRAISLDLDDTLWPIWPTIARAEEVLHAWLQQHAPATAQRYDGPAALRGLREAIVQARPDLAHDLSALRRESIRLALRTAGDDPDLAEPAFELFLAERHRVTLYDDARPALARLAARYPIVSLTNGNAELERIGLADFFVGSVTARGFGVAKPDARIFQAAAALTGMPPDAVLHVGDDALLDVLGAQRAGLQAAWTNRGGAAWAHEERPHLEVAELGALCAALGL